MSLGLSKLSSMEYPGRVLILGAGLKAGETIVVYAITGRSPSSQARRLEWSEDGVWVRPTDEEVLSKGNSDLLVYPAALHFAGGLAVSNGRQTADIRQILGQEKGAKPETILSISLSSWDYEPDAPIYTPRISGCVAPGPRAALSLIKRGPDGSVIRRIYEAPLSPGKGKMISTYDGVNRDPLRSFEGDPLDVDLEASDAGGLSEAVYEALKPADPARDFRVSVACLFAGDIALNEYEVSIINRQERN